MTISAFEVKVVNTDRGTTSTKHFSGQHDAQRYFDKYKMTPGDNVQLVHIEDRSTIIEK